MFGFTLFECIFDRDSATMELCGIETLCEIRSLFYFSHDCNGRWWLDLFFFHIL